MTDQTAQPDSTDNQSTNNQYTAGRVSRRSLFRAAGVGAAVVGGGAFLEACSSGIQGAASSSSASAARPGAARAASAGGGVGQGDHDRLDPPADRRAGRLRLPGQLRAAAGRWPPRSSRTGSRSAAATYPVTVKSYDTQSSVTRAGQPGQAGHPAGQRRPAARLLDPGDRQRRRVPGRDPRHPADLLQHPVGVLVHQPRRQPAEAHPEPEAHHHVLPRRRAPRARVRADVGPDRRKARQQPQGRRRVPERLRRQRVPRRVPRRYSSRWATPSTSRPPTPTG